MRKRKKGASGIVKTIPLSIALAALSTGTAFADTAETQFVQVEQDGAKYKFDLNRLSNADYAESVKKMLTGKSATEALTDAFKGGKSILVQVGEEEWVKFSEDASSVLTLADIEADKENHSSNPDDNAITPYNEEI
jgi:hypothetical protein